MDRHRTWIGRSGEMQKKRYGDGDGDGDGDGNEPQLMGHARTELGQGMEKSTCRAENEYEVL